MNYLNSCDLLTYFRETVDLVLMDIFLVFLQVAFLSEGINKQINNTTQFNYD